jgi:hypothetical protein
VGAYGIQHHVAGEFEQILVFVDQNRRVATLEEVPDLAVPAVEGLGVDPV